MTPKEFNDFIDSLPKRVGETPKEVLWKYIQANFIAKSELREAIEKLEKFANYKTGEGNALIKVESLKSTLNL